MRFLKACRLAFFGLWANRIRVFFSMLGVIIGVLAIIILVSIGTGAEKMVTKQMNGLGPEQIMVMPGRVLKTEQGQKDFLNGIASTPSTLTYEDAKEIEKMPLIQEVTPHLETVLRASYGQQTVDSVITGVTASYENVAHLQLQEGRFLTPADEQTKQQVAVIGSDIERRLLNLKEEEEEAASGTQPAIWKKIKLLLFGKEASAATMAEKTLVGQNIQISGKTFQVIGVLQAQNSLGSNVNNAIILPISTALEATNTKYLAKIYVQAKDTKNMKQTQNQIIKAIRKHHTERDFSVVEQTEMLKVTNSITTILQVMVMSIAGMAFLISGIGIMNVMVMSVRERTREIGIRKTLGAKRRDILYQFFLETFLLTTIGGMIGLLIGYGIVELWNEYVVIFPLVLTAWAVKLALGSAMLTGCIFGVYPAMKAARLQPSHALRYGD